MDANTPLIRLNHVYAGYDQSIVLEDINLDIMPLDFIGIVGPNGGGKSTLLKVILGLLPVRQGIVTIEGKTPEEGRNRLGYVPQYAHFDHQFPINVRQVVEMSQTGRNSVFHRQTREERESIERALDRVGMLGLASRPIGELSGGQRQRVYIARALAADPHVLLLDEPTASIDIEGRASVYQLLSELNEKIAILLISHDIGTISSFVKTVGCMSRKLFYHHDKQLTPEMIDEAYHCPVDLIAHGVPHRVFALPHSEDPHA